MNNRGMALITTLLFLVLLAVSGAIAARSSIFGLGISAHHKTDRQSYYIAEAGVAYPIAQIQEQLEAGTLAFWGPSITATYSAPTTFDLLPGNVQPFTTFTQVTLNKIPDTDRYRFQVTGKSGGASTKLEIEVERSTFANYGVFGTDKIKIDNHATVYSYDSSFSAPALTDFPADSTGKGSVATNGTIDLNNWAAVDGSAIRSNSGFTDIKGHAATSGGVEILTGTIASDPLDVVPLVNFYSTHNDNNLIGGVTTITGSKVLPAGNYYLTEVDLPNNAVISVNGPVKIFLNGKFRTGNNCRINYSTSGGNLTAKPPNLQIFSKSNESIIIDNNSFFTGSIYAPNARVITDHGSTYLGMMWGKESTVDNNATLIFDTSFRSAIGYNTLDKKSWKQLPN